MMFISFALDQKYRFLEKLVTNLLSCYKILCKLFNLTMENFYFSKLVKIPESVSALKSVLFNFKIILEREQNFCFISINYFLVKNVLKKCFFRQSYPGDIDGFSDKPVV